MLKLLSEMTRADWLTRRWVNTSPPGSTEMMFTDAGDFSQEQRTALLAILHSRRGAEPTVEGTGGAANSDELLAR